MKVKNYKDALSYWQMGIAYDPQRAECWYHSARRHSWDHHPGLAYCFAKQASEIKCQKVIVYFKKIFINFGHYMNGA